MLPATSGRSYVLRANRSRFTTKAFSHEMLSLASTSWKKSCSHFHTINGNPFDTQLVFKRTKAGLSPAQNRKLRIKNTAGTHSSPSSPARVPPVLFSCAGWEKAGGEVARQQLKIDGGKLAPHEPVSQYQHNRTGEDNADAHLKRQVMGREVVVAITKGKLDLGPWEQIFHGEFDGRRRKRVLVKIIGE
jgi:hypothetical protein